MVKPASAVLTLAVVLPLRTTETLLAGAVPAVLTTVPKTTSTLGVMPLYPIFNATPPSAAAPAALFWRTKATPSPPVALGPIWNWK
jgi:hypothetical protein